MVGRGKTWSPEESVSACIAFCRASENPLKGTDQRAEVFTKDVDIRWKELCALQREKGMVHEDGMWCSRSGRAVIQHYKKVKAEVLKLESALARVKAWKPTGDLADKELMSMAIAVHKGEQLGTNLYAYVGSDAKPTPSGSLYKAWEWMRGQRLLMQVAAASKASNSSIDCTDTRDDAERVSNYSKKRLASSDSVSSPQGTKKAKSDAEYQHCIAQIAKSIKSKGESLDAFVKIERERLELEKGAIERRLFEQADDAEAKEYFTLQRQIALARLRSRVQELNDKQSILQASNHSNASAVDSATK